MYKRQELYWAKEEEAGLEEDEEIPVSYTHLDVYKRQTDIQYYKEENNDICWISLGYQ